jgi:inosose dehydratase
MSVGNNYPWEKLLGEIAEAGYQGTELGPYGYYPTDPKELAAALSRHNLGLGSSYVPVALSDPNALEASIKEVLTVGRLLSTQGVAEVIVADAGNAERERIAGRVKAGSGWSDATWKQALAALDTIAQKLHDELEMRVVIHHHAGTYFETPEEIDRLLAGTRAGLVDLLLDTGHYLYGGGDPVDGLKRHGDRIRYVHFKDVDAERLKSVHTEELDLKRAWARGVFCPLGRGAIDFVKLGEGLKSRGYDGWVIVEQDVIPGADGKLDPPPFESARESRKYLRERLGI